MISSVALSRLVDTQPEPIAGNHLIRQGFPIWQNEPAPERTLPAEQRDALQLHCESLAMELGGKLGPGCATLVRAPYILAGDFTEAELQQWYTQTVAPAVEIMASCYDLVPPSEPITLLLFRDQASYEGHSLRLYGDQGISIFGYYKPQSRVVVANLGSGGGTLLHELTHALFAFDFPRMPDWFNEGIASLHEQASLELDRREITGLVNWRLPVLRQAEESGTLGSIHDLVTGHDFRGADQGVHYAQARYFCMYLQQQGKLSEYYTLFRDQQVHDRSGAAALAVIFPGQSWQQINDDFLAWLQTLPR